MTNYSDLYFPAAPVAEIQIRNSDSLSQVRALQMLMDTGSDVTLIPVRYCNEIGIEIGNRSIDLTGFDGANVQGVFVGFYL